MSGQARVPRNHTKFDANFSTSISNPPANKLDSFPQDLCIVVFCPFSAGYCVVRFTDYPFGIFKLLFYLDRLLFRWKALCIVTLERRAAFAYTRRHDFTKLT